MEIERIGVVGAGQMGQTDRACAVLAGYEVVNQRYFPRCAFDAGTR